MGRDLIERAGRDVHATAVSLIRGNPENILDVGCGTGALLERVHDRFPESKLSGCDLEGQLSSFNELDLKLFDFNGGLKFEDESFDTITCVEVIEHLENPFYTFRELHRILKPRGQLIMSSPNVENIFSRILYLFFGKFVHFFSDTDLDKKTFNHIEPIFLWKWKMLAEDLFDIEFIAYNRGVVPFVNLPLWKSSLTGEIRLLRMRKK